jgi:hypothetical protein
MCAGVSYQYIIFSIAEYTSTDLLSSLCSTVTKISSENALLKEHVMTELTVSRFQGEKEGLVWTYMSLFVRKV